MMSSKSLITESFHLIDEVPPPTVDDVAERLVKRLIHLCQRGEWDGVTDSLKVRG